MESTTKQILTDTIHINPSDINVKNINGLILVKIKQLRENKCNSVGYILQNSVQFINKTIGKISSIDRYSKIVYNVRYECEVLNPSVGDNIECYINDISKMGIIAYITIKNTDKLFQNSPLIIVVPLEHIKNVESYSKDDKINVNVLASRIKFNSNKIQIIGKINI